MAMVIDSPCVVRMIVHSKETHLNGEDSLTGKKQSFFYGWWIVLVNFMADFMAVMQAGKIVEQGEVGAIYKNPREEYTRTLIEAVPRDSLEDIRARVTTG